MPSIGPLEIGIIAVVVLLIFGPRRLPELGRSLGGGMREFKDSITGRELEQPSVETVDQAPSQVSPERRSSDSP